LNEIHQIVVIFSASIC